MKGFVHLVELLEQNPWTTGLAALVVFLGVLLFLFVQDPDRIDKVKAKLLEPLFRHFRFASRQYLAAKIGSSATEFLRRHVTNLAPSLQAVKLQLRWVISPRDPVLREDGILIIPVRETPDQALNILAATRIALPHIVCPTLRANLSSDFENAIDLAILRRLAEQLGSHAQPVFQRHFLSEMLADSARIGELFGQLVELDNHGIFVSIFLEEINVLGQRLYADGAVRDKSKAVEDFLEFLLQFPRRQPGQHVQLLYVAPDFRVGVILVAITWRTEVEGTLPYVSRIQKNLTAGADSIYLYAFTPAFKFMKRLLDAVRNEEKVWITQINTVKIRQMSGELSEAQIVLLRRNTLFADASFTERVEANQLVEGEMCQGTVIDVSPNACLVDVRGIGGTISRADCSWLTIDHCGEILEKDRTYDFLLKKIDTEKQLITLSLRVSANDPWLVEGAPREGEEVDVRIVSAKGQNYFCRYKDNIEVIVPRTEMSWFPDLPPSKSKPGTVVRVKVYERLEDEHVLRASVRQLTQDPWPDLQKNLRPGSQMRGVVRGVGDNIVIVELPGGLPAFITDAEMKKAGFEYANYRENLVPGAGLDVVVEKVFLVRRKVRVNLSRNVAANEMRLTGGRKTKTR
jgi:hypothetical protein